MNGTKDVFAFLTALADPETMKAKLAEYEALDAQIAAKLKALGLVGEVEALVSRARADRTEAAETKALAKTQAATAATEQAAGRAEADTRLARLKAAAQAAGG